MSQIMPAPISIVRLRHAILQFDKQILNNQDCSELLVNRSICQKVLDARIAEEAKERAAKRTPSLYKWKQHFREPPAEPSAPRVLSVSELKEAITDLSSDIEKDPENSQLLLNRVICEEVLNSRFSNPPQIVPNTPIKSHTLKFA